MTFRYAFCGDEVWSSTELPELVPVGPDAPATASPWMCGAGQVPDESVCVPVHEWADPEGGVWLRLSRQGTTYRLAFQMDVVFVVDGRRIRWRAGSGVPALTIRHLLLDQVLPLAMSGIGALVLHASAVLAEERAVLFAGPSGSGKSTLAAWCATRGHACLADDCVRLHEDAGAWAMYAAYPGLRVWPHADALIAGLTDGASPVAHYTSKVRVDLPAPSSPGGRVGRIYLIRETDRAPRVQRAGAQAVVDVARFAFNLDITNRERLAEHFGRAFRLVDGGLVRYLDVPRAPGALDAVYAAIREDLRETLSTAERCA